MKNPGEHMLVQQTTTPPNARQSRGSGLNRYRYFGGCGIADFSTAQSVEESLHERCATCPLSRHPVSTARVAAAVRCNGRPRWRHRTRPGQEGLARETHGAEQRQTGRPRPGCSGRHGNSIDADGCTRADGRACCGNADPNGHHSLVLHLD